MKDISVRIRSFAMASLFAGIIFLMTFTPIGFIPLGAMNATIVHVPVIIGSLILGPRMGALLGFLFGLASLIRATMTPALLSFCFSPLIPVPGTGHGSAWALVICFLPRVLVGIVPYYTDKFISSLAAKGEKRLKFVSMFAAGIAGSMTNTLLVMGLVSEIFRGAYAQATNLSAEAVRGAIFSIITLHGVPEALVAGTITAAVGKAVSLANRPNETPGI
jgi:uncharacterized membrane protein